MRPSQRENTFSLRKISSISTINSRSVQSYRSIENADITLYDTPYEIFEELFSDEVNESGKFSSDFPSETSKVIIICSNSSLVDSLINKDDLYKKL